MKHYPEVGDTWEFTAPDGCGILSGAVASVRLDREDDRIQVWIWTWRYADGSGFEHDWAPSYRQAASQAAQRFEGRCKVRFRKVKHKKS